MPTQMTLKNEGGEYSVTIVYELMDLPTLMQDLVRPLLLAAGYHPGSVDEQVPPL